MTKKDYELFAKNIWLFGIEGNETKNIINLCKIVFRQDNPLFKAEKFEEACLTGKHIRKSIKG